MAGGDAQDDLVRGLWFYDWYTSDELHAHRMGEVLVDRRTPFQRVMIQRSPFLGRCLVTDHKIQSAEVDEHIYHELLVHPAVVAHSDPRQVLILGGGEGATLREVLRHPVASVTMVDIDAGLVELCREHLPSWHQGAFDDPRVRLVFDDGRRYVEEQAAAYDVIISDISDPIAGAPSARLFTRQFYGTLAARLRPGGIIAVQALGIRYDASDRAHAAIHRTLRAVLPVVRSYMDYIYSFDSLWGFVTASPSVDPAALAAEEVDRRLAARDVRGLRFYDGEAHARMFRLPRPLREALAVDGPVIDDAALLEID
ncbi:MAG: fused MFS/spermidine synthase [Armatimonadetes bacterium]|nr:fused MFS/spermidine synthase [Armatimonadota bacterium]